MSYRKSRFKHDIIEKRYDVSITRKTFKLNVRNVNNAKMKISLEYKKLAKHETKESFHILIKTITCFEIASLNISLVTLW